MPNRPVAILRTIRGELPPSAGDRWALDIDHSDAELITSHPILGARKHTLRLVSGTLSGTDTGQFELELGFACSESILFRSTCLSRSDTFRYLAKGELCVGPLQGIAVVRIHDLSWVIGQNPREVTRILSMTSNVERAFWQHDHHPIRAPWLTRSSAQLFLHSEWLPVTTPPYLNAS